MSQPNEYASYGWIISHDHVAPNPTESDAGTVGPSNIDPVFEKRLKARIDLDENFDDGDIADLNGTMTKFKMLDADGNLYYVGYIDGDYDLTEPLDDFGTPNAGAIYLKALEKDGSWSSAVEAE
jgi:hypothetical protein